jgi:hypothetical protein
MAVNKNISKAKSVARTKRPAPVKVAKIPLVNSATTVEPVVLTSAPQTEPVLTEVVSYPEPETTVKVNRTPSVRGVVVGLIGAGIGGYMAYNSLIQVFQAKGYNEDDSRQYALYSGVAVGLLTFALLYKITKN